MKADNVGEQILAECEALAALEGHVPESLDYGYARRAFQRALSAARGNDAGACSDAKYLADREALLLVERKQGETAVRLLSAAGFLASARGQLLRAEARPDEATKQIGLARRWLRGARRALSERGA